MNADGWPDVLQAGNGVRNTYLGKPGGGFENQARSAWAFPTDFRDSVGYRGVALADLDGDGSLDVLHRLLNLTGYSAENTTCGVSRNAEVGALVGGAWVNTGSGWVWAEEHRPPVFQYPTHSENPQMISCPVEGFPLATRLEHLPSGSMDQGTRLIDLNGDGEVTLSTNGVFRHLTTSFLKDGIR